MPERFTAYGHKDLSTLLQLHLLEPMLNGIIGNRASTSFDAPAVWRLAALVCGQHVLQTWQQHHALNALQGLLTLLVIVMIFWWT
jgi:hypothetical protein